MKTMAAGRQLKQLQAHESCVPSSQFFFVCFLELIGIPRKLVEDGLSHDSDIFHSLIHSSTIQCHTQAV